MKRWNDGVEPGSGAQRIAAERQRQILTEGYGYHHDDAYDDTSLLDAASCYLDWTISEAAGDDPEEYYGKLPAQWPWAARHFKPDSIERNLEKAGALIAAELDRRRRAIERGGD